MKKLLVLVLMLCMVFTAMAAAHAEPIEVELWHYFDSSNDKDMINQWVDEYNTLQDKIHINATYVSRQELMNQYAIGAISGAFSRAFARFVQGPMAMIVTSSGCSLTVRMIISSAASSTGPNAGVLSP